ncbi:glycosyltransferase family 39 protein [Pseudonocardia sp. NPDC046786]|uniref:ArnT family glycosyltransferase n=1 Tax=Pseudonocardia sp. NPDC046786 TaxID=3155471 RepID=UPI003408ADC2
MTTTLDRDPATAADPAPPPRRRRREPIALIALLVGAGLLYLWNLGASGYANSFYAAAVQAGANDWTAFLFGSLDPSNGITVDKPPASLWPMEIAARLFGFGPWSLLVPQALMGVAAVWLLYAAVRRVSGHGAGLLAGALLALTPVAALMFRFDNPDALLTLLLVAAAYLVVRGVDDGRTRWIVAAGLVIGVAFLTKSLQAFLVLPGLALAYLCAAPGGLWRRSWQLVAGAAGIVAGAGWWLLTVALWPVDARPWIGGSGDNTPLGLALGYNGLSRIVGGAGGGPGGGGGGSFGGEPGLLRMFGAAFGTQVSWLLPAALLLLVAALVARGRAPRTDPVRASLLLWGGWTLVTVLVFSLMGGIVHPYYAVALAPGIAALVAIGGRTLLGPGAPRWSRAVLAAATAVTAVWAFVMLGWSPEFLPWLRWVVLVAGLLAAAALLLPSRLVRPGRVLAVVLGVAVLAGAAAPAAYAVQTAATTHTGSTPSAGPEVAGAGGGPGGMPSGGAGPGGGGMRADGIRADGGMPEGTGSGPDGGTRGAGPGEAATGTELTELLRTAGDARWAAATIGSQRAASMMLAAGGDTAVLAIGGWSGGDAYPTLEQFQQYVEHGEIRWFVDGGDGGPGGERGTGPAIAAWVAEHYAATTVGDSVVHDLSAPVR